MKYVLHVILVYHVSYVIHVIHVCPVFHAVHIDSCNSRDSRV